MDIKAVLSKIFSFFCIASSLFSFQLGDGTDTNRLSPVRVMDNVKFVSASAWTTLFIKNDGSLWGCGDNTKGQLGYKERGIIRTPVLLSKDIKTAGSNMFGIYYVNNKDELFEAGSTVKHDRGNYYRTGIEQPRLIDGDVKSIAVNDSCLLYVKNDGSLWKYGDTDKPSKIMSGVEEVFAKDLKNPIIIKSGSDSFKLEKEATRFVKNVKKISGGMILLNDGELLVCGSNLYGSLGVEGKENVSEPAHLMNGVLDIASNEDHSLIVNSKNELFVCGGGDEHYRCGATGDGNNGVHYKPYKICDDAISVEVGAYNSFVIKKDGSCWAFGLNDYGSGY